MFPQMKCCFRASTQRRKGSTLISFLVIQIGSAISPLISTEKALAQSSYRQTRLQILQQQNAFQQQQSAVQTALQQTTILVQSLNQNVVQQPAAPPPISFQSQVNTLQLALQQTTALQQTATRSNTALAQLASRQQNVLQTVLQQTLAVQGTSSQGTQLSASQVQLLTQEQNSLTELLTTLPRPLQQRKSGR